MLTFNLFFLLSLYPGVSIDTFSVFFVHAMPDESENGGFTLKTHQMFSVHTTPEKDEDATISGHFGFTFEKNSGRGMS